MKRKTLIFWTLLFTWVSSDAQDMQAKEVATPNKGFLFAPHFTLHQPLYDLGERFITFNAVGLDIHFKTKKNFQFGLEYDWFYGKKVKERNLFDSLIGASGQLIDIDGNFAIYRLNIKGHYLTANAGYLYPIQKKYPNSGLLFSVGIGYLQHKIDIQSSTTKIPQINGEYEKGYDRLTSGLACKQFIGYQYLVPQHKFHFRLGAEFNQGFTKGRRTWDFTANAPGNLKRFDATLALKFSIIVPVYTKDAEDEEFFID